MHKTVLFDQFTPVALYGKIKELFPNEITMLFESMVNSSDGNFSFIVIGASERLSYKNKTTIHTSKDGKENILKEDPFAFLKSYYANINQDEYKQKAIELGFSFVDGFIGFISYDMVKVFEPVLEESMDKLLDPLNTPDLDLIRPKIIIAYSHKSAKLTLIQNDDSLKNGIESIEELLNSNLTPMPVQNVQLDGEGSFSINEERFKELVLESKESIRSGDIFQILLSNRYTQKGKIDPLSFYRVLRSKNPSPYLFIVK